MITTLTAAKGGAMDRAQSPAGRSSRRGSIPVVDSPKHGSSRHGSPVTQKLNGPKARKSILKVAYVVNEDTEAQAAAAVAIEHACRSDNFHCDRVDFSQLDYGVRDSLDAFYNADVVIVDMTGPSQQRVLFYHTGIRESMNMTQAIILCHDTGGKKCADLKAFISSAQGSKQNAFIAYNFFPTKKICTSEISGRKTKLQDEILKTLEVMEVYRNDHVKEKFKQDLRNLIDSHKGKPPELKEKLKAKRKELDDPQLLSTDIVLNLLLAFRDVQDYDGMVELFESASTLSELDGCAYEKTEYLTYLYAFALNRRKNPGDTDKALQVAKKSVEKADKEKTQVSFDLLCLLGRIYKDKFTESDYVDLAARDEATKWYKRGFELQPTSAFAGINVATLMVVSGKEENDSQGNELGQIFIKLSNIIGRKGALETLKSYWDVATFFEISVLAKNYSNAIQAAEYMFKLKPQIWQLKSLMLNISLIERIRRSKENDEQKRASEAYSVERESILFQWWLEFFVVATGDQRSVRFPVLLMEPNREFIPSYVSVNHEADEKSLELWYAWTEKSKKLDEWKFIASSIKRIQPNTQDDRCIFLYVNDTADDFPLYFPSSVQKDAFADLLRNVTEEIQDQDEEDLDNEEFQFHYVENDRGGRAELGRGSYGVVFAGRDDRKGTEIAIKELKLELLQGDENKINREIQLHSKLNHRNVVRYFGSEVDRIGGYLKIFMERIPGGSLSKLLREMFGPLNKNVRLIADYTRQILGGLQYLHRNNIVHRDIKGDNILVNTYDGTVKISDFGTSRRLTGVGDGVGTFAGTMQYMAPEVIDQGHRGYGKPADIWSLGCTIVEMATGEPPFRHIGGQAAMFKVGYFKVHPEIPEDLSKECVDFTKKCFVPTPEERPTCDDLLGEPFLNKGKKGFETRSLSNQDGNNNGSVGGGMPGSPSKLRVSRSSASESLGQFSSGATTPNSPIAVKEPFSGGGGGGDGGGGSVNPVNAVSTTGSNPSLSERRDKKAAPLKIPSIGSNGRPIDPPAIRHPSSVASANLPFSPESGHKNFTRIKADVKYKAYLTDVLKKNSSEICEKWKRLLVDVNIRVEDLEQILLVFVEVVNRQRRDQDHEMQQLVEDLKSRLNNYDTRAFLMMSNTIKEAIQDVIKTQPKFNPHKMFHLSDILDIAIKRMRFFITPDSSPGTPADGQPPLEQFPPTESFDLDDVDADLPMSERILANVSGSINFALQQLLETQREMNKMLLDAVQEKKLQMEHLQLLMDAPGFGATQRLMFHQQQPPSQQTDLGVEDQTPVPTDESLMQWLRKHSIKEEAIHKIVFHEYTLDDLLQQVTREELVATGMRHGSVCRIWNAILNHRHGGE